MKVDCSKTLNYFKELKRMCTSGDGCEGCPLDEYSCCIINDITQEHIDIVQKWSDEHQRETMAEHFFKMFPNAPKNRDGNPKVCPDYLGWDEIIAVDCDRNCTKCWTKPYVHMIKNL